MLRDPPLSSKLKNVRRGRSQSAAGLETATREELRLTATQEPLFPDIVPRRIVSLYPSLVERWTVSPDRERRMSAHVATIYADKLHQRAESYTGEGNLFETMHFVNQWFKFWNYVEEMQMSGKKAATDQYERPAWKGFVERPLTDEELETLDNWHPKPAEIWEAVNMLSEAGYDFKLSYSKALGAATATMVDQRPKQPLAGYALSARDGNGALALKALLYKHTACLAGDWSALIGKPRKAARG